ncbi:hypothetical protein Plhal304r1_c072g0160471 [Plasmopara halstedii]
MLVGFKGTEGVFSEVATRVAFEVLRAAEALTPNDFMTVGLAHINDVVEAVERNELAYGVLPMLWLCVFPGVTMIKTKQPSSHPAVLDHLESHICAMELKLGRIFERNAA